MGHIKYGNLLKRFIILMALPLVLVSCGMDVLIGGDVGVDNSSEDGGGGGGGGGGASGVVGVVFPTTFESASSTADAVEYAPIRIRGFKNYSANDGTDGIDGGTDGTDGGTDGIDGGTDGIDGGTDGIDGGTDGIDGGTDGIDGGTDGTDGGTDGIDDGTETPYLSETVLPATFTPDTNMANITFMVRKGSDKNTDIIPSYKDGNIVFAFDKLLVADDYKDAVFNVQVMNGNTQLAGFELTVVPYDEWVSISSVSMPLSVGTVEDMSGVAYNIIPFIAGSEEFSTSLMEITYSPADVSNTGLSVEVSGNNPEAFEYRLVKDGGKYYLAITANDADKSAVFKVTTDAATECVLGGVDECVSEPVSALIKVKTLDPNALEPVVYNASAITKLPKDISTNALSHTTEVTFLVDAAEEGDKVRLTSSKSMSLFTNFGAGTVEETVNNGAAVFTLTNTKDANIFKVDATETLTATLVDSDGNTVLALDEFTPAPVGTVVVTIAQPENPKIESGLAGDRTYLFTSGKITMNNIVVNKGDSADGLTFEAVSSDTSAITVQTTFNEGSGIATLEATAVGIADAPTTITTRFRLSTNGSYVDAGTITIGKVVVRPKLDRDNGRSNIKGYGQGYRFALYIENYYESASAMELFDLVSLTSDAGSVVFGPTYDSRTAVRKIDSHKKSTQRPGSFAEMRLIKVNCGDTKTRLTIYVVPAFTGEMTAGEVRKAAVASGYRHVGCW